MSSLAAVPPPPASIAQDALSPRASFSTLPNELKARIVAMVHDQDQKYHLYQLQHTLLGTEWYGKGIPALRLTSTELSSLASVHLFKTVPLCYMTGPFFLYSILPRRSSLVKEVILDYTCSKVDRNIVRESFGLLPALYNLHQLSLESQALRHMLGRDNFDVQDDEDESYIDDTLSPEDAEALRQRNWERSVQRHLNDAFAALARRVQHLYLEDVSPEQTCAILNIFKEVRILSLSLHGGDDEYLYNADVVSSFAALSGLEELHLLYINDEIEWLAKRWESASTIRVLCISLHSSTTTLLPLVASFRNLTRLELVYSPPASLSSASTQTRSSTSLSTLSCLEHVSLTIHRSGDFDFFAQSFATLPSLKSFILSFGRSYPLTNFSDMSNLLNFDQYLPPSLDRFELCTNTLLTRLQQDDLRQRLLGISYLKHINFLITSTSSAFAVAQSDRVGGGELSSVQYALNEVYAEGKRLLRVANQQLVSKLLGQDLVGMCEVMKLLKGVGDYDKVQRQ